MIVCPVPQKWKWQEGSLLLSETVYQTLFRELQKGVKRGTREQLDRSLPGTISFLEDRTLSEEGYRLTVLPERIEIKSATETGAFYALATLRQMLLQTEYCKGKGVALECCQIEDEPDFAVRGVMLDISRNKIPTLDTLYELVDLFASVKLNHLELYLEGFAFAYPSFEALWRAQEDSMPFTGEEIRLLDAYCKERFIDLTPNQNCLGHMTAWLAPGAFPELAEKPEGSKLFGFVMPPGTLDPSDPGSLKLVEQMSDDLLQHFTSENFNVNLDEPFELGQGKNQERIEQEGMGAVYLEYVQKIYQMVTKKGRHMLLWGDILTRHPETLSALPEDVTVLDWNYDAVTPFEAHAKMLSEAGRDFWLCPGSGAWASFSGRTENMLENIRDAAVTGKRYGAKGLLLTDWGDGGHMNPLPVSYPAYLYAAALSWRAEEKSEKEEVKGKQYLAAVLDRFVYQDRAGIMGELTLQMGCYQQFEEYPVVNRTLTNTVFWFAGMEKERLPELTKMLAYQLADMICDPAGQRRERELLDAADGIYDGEGLEAFLEELLQKLNCQQMEHPKRELIEQEYRLAIGLVKLCAKLRRAWMEGKPEPPEHREQQKKLRELLSETWLARNKERGLQDTLKVLDGLESTKKL